MLPECLCPSTGTGPPRTSLFSSFRLVAATAIIAIGLMAGCGSSTESPPAEGLGQTDVSGSGDGHPSEDLANSDLAGTDAAADVNVSAGSLAVNPTGPGGGGSVMSSSRYDLGGRVVSIPYRGEGERFSMVGGM